MKKFVIIDLDQTITTYVIEANNKEEAENRVDTIGDSYGIIMTKNVVNESFRVEVIDLEKNESITNIRHNMKL